MSDCLTLKKSNCKNCYKCIRHCPVKSIRFTGNQAYIIENECILCGQCFVVCPQNAKEIVDETEKVKVLLAQALFGKPDIILLDEPTNHLDVDAKDELKRALKEFKGSVLLVSHEPEFYEDWVDKVWNIEDWTTKII